MVGVDFHLPFSYVEGIDEVGAQASCSRNTSFPSTFLSWTLTLVVDLVGKYCEVERV